MPWADNSGVCALSHVGQATKTSTARRGPNHIVHRSVSYGRRRRQSVESHEEDDEASEKTGVQGIVGTPHGQGSEGQD